MNKSILINNIAKEDIIKISDYIAKDNKIAAIDIITNFYKTFELLSNYPETGVIKNYITNKTIRIYTMKKNYTIVYRIVGNSIEILRVLTRYQNIFAVLN